MEALPDVIINIQVLFVNIVPHVDMREDVLQLCVVVVWDWSEWIEQIWVHLFRLQQFVPLLFFRCFFLLCRVRKVPEVVSAEKHWIDEHMGVIAGAAKCTQRVCLHFLN